MPCGARDGTLALMQTGSRHHRYTYNEYVELELHSSTKHEFLDGEIYAMEQHEPSPKATALNPMVLLEVTRDSSEEYDTGDKLRFYETIPSLKEYIVVSHRERRLTVHQRQTEPTTQVDVWVARVAIPGGQVEVPSVGISLDCDVVYRNSNIR